MLLFAAYSAVNRRFFCITPFIHRIKISKCSRDTALRDIQDLERKKILIKGGAGGRSTSYFLSFNPSERYS